MIQPEIVIVPATFGIPAAVIVIRMWFRHQERMATMDRPETRTLDSGELQARLARVEEAIDAMSVEMERVGEGQRFLTKVLGERLPVGAQGQGRVMEE